MTARNTPVDSPYQPEPDYGTVRPPGEIPTIDNSTYMSDDDVISVWDPVKMKYVEYSYWHLKAMGWMPNGIRAAAAGYWADKIQARYEQELLGSFGGGGGGRRSGGAIGPTYIKPSEDAVRENVKAYVVATTGTNDERLIEKALAAFMDGSQQAFDKRESEQVEPWTFVQKVVRESASYKAIHQLRPESVDEMDWVVDRQAKLRSLGLSAERAESLGARQAQSGSNDAALVEAAEMANVADTGRLLQSQRQGLVNSARAVMGLI